MMLLAMSMYLDVCERANTCIFGCNMVVSLNLVSYCSDLMENMPW